MTSHDFPSVYPRPNLRPVWDCSYCVEEVPWRDDHGSIIIPCLMVDSKTYLESPGGTSGTSGTSCRFRDSVADMSGLSDQYVIQ